MPRFEFELGVFIDAANEQEALDILSPAMILLENVDAEGECAMEIYEHKENQ